MAKVSLNVCLGISRRLDEYGSFSVLAIRDGSVQIPLQHFHYHQKHSHEIDMYNSKIISPQNFEMYQEQRDLPLRIVPFWLPVETISLSTTLFILPLHCKVYRRMNGCHSCNFILEYSYILSCIFFYIYVLHKHTCIHVYRQKL